MVVTDTDDLRARRNALRLAIAQALAGANSTVVFATGSLIGATLAPSPALATVPLSLYVLGMAGGSLPTGWLARRYGRRAAFLVGSGVGVLAGLTGTLALSQGLFALYCLGTFFSGLYGATVQSFRFAAADGASAAFRPRAVSWVLAGGVFAGVLGPQLVTHTMSLLPALFAASYVAQAAVALAAMAILAAVDLPRPLAASRDGRPLGQIVRQPRFVIAALCGVVSYALMNLVMTAAPLAMHLCGLAVTASNDTIQWHVVAMYGPSFVTGGLIARFGAPRIVAAGLLLLAGSAFAGLSGVQLGNFTVALVLLGIGWNFGFVGATAMVLETHRPEERTRVQSLNDFLVFGTMAVGSFASGQVLIAYGWATVNLIVFPPVALGLAALLLTGSLTRTAPQPAE